MPEKPEWVKEHPVSSNYYIGVGSISKNGQSLNYREQAKKNALNDLASEISVTIDNYFPWNQMVALTKNLNPP